MGTQGRETDVVFLSGKRTGFGTFGGTLKDFSATQLAAISSKAAMEAAGVEPGQIQHAFFGNALQTSSDAIYLARNGVHVLATDASAASRPMPTRTSPLRCASRVASKIVQLPPMKHSKHACMSGGSSSYA